MRRGVHQGLHLGVGWEQGVEASIIAVRVDRVEENHWSIWLGEGVIGGGRTTQSLSLPRRPGESASSQPGLGLFLSAEGGGVKFAWGRDRIPLTERKMRPRSGRQKKLCGLRKAR